MFDPPPGSGTLEANMTDELVGALDGTASQGIAAPAQPSIVYPVLVSGKIFHQPVPALPFFLRAAKHALQPGDNMLYIVMKQANLGLLHPLRNPIRIVAEMELGKIVKTLGAVIIIKDLSALGKDLLNSFPYPSGAIADETEPDHVERNDVLLPYLQEITDEILFCANLVPAEKMDDMILVKEIAPYSFDFPPYIGISLVFRPDGCHGSIRGKDENGPAMLPTGNFLYNPDNFISSRDDFGEFYPFGQFIGKGSGQCRLRCWPGRNH